MIFVYRFILAKICLNGNYILGRISADLLTLQINMPTIDTVQTESWDDLWGDMVADFALKLIKIKKIEDFRLEVESCKLWLRKNSDSLSQLEPGRVAELIRTTFEFGRAYSVQQAVIEMALMELGLTPLNQDEGKVIDIRSRIFKGIQN